MRGHGALSGPQPKEGVWFMSHLHNQTMKNIQLLEIDP